MNEHSTNEYPRRDFLRETSAAIMALMGGVPIQAAEEAKEAGATHYEVVEDPLGFGVVGCGRWGREIIQTLGRLPNAPVLGVCDTYQPFLNRCKELAPKAQHHTDFRELLARKEIQAVVVATPSHQHRDVAIEALKAGKHVYCEAPLATTFEDGRAIAQAARAAFRVNFQVGLQNRSDPQMLHVARFFRMGVLGVNLKARSQAQKKTTWRLASPNPDREKEANWRLDRSVSLGLAGEVGLHQADLARWFLGARPEAVTGYGTLLQWQADGRDVPDTVQAIFEYPGGVLHSQEVTIANSFDSDYDVFYGSDRAVMIRDRSAWMFNESDAPLLGWEVFARKEVFYRENGVVLNADASKLSEAEKKKAMDSGATKLSLALQRFITNSLLVASTVEDFVNAFGDKDQAALQAQLNSVARSRLPAAGWKEGYETAIIALKTNEAILKRQRIVFAKEWFEVT
jgi:predicted dehydrogenase